VCISGEKSNAHVPTVSQVNTPRNARHFDAFYPPVKANGERKHIDSPGRERVFLYKGWGEQNKLKTPSNFVFHE